MTAEVPLESMFGSIERHQVDLASLVESARSDVTEIILAVIVPSSARNVFTQARRRKSGDFLILIMMFPQD